jgi:DNA-binding CsgD family transcriptional regulator
VRPLHDALRLGAIGECAPRLWELATIVDGRLAPAAAAHAAALEADDADALERVANELNELGMLLIAAEALTAASRAYARRGLQARARNAGARCEVLVKGCEGLRANWLLGDQESSLTTREREIATLAARGYTNREIADRLVVSVRTVEGHLYRAYAKLGVSNRDQLAATLGVRPDNGRENA